MKNNLVWTKTILSVYRYLERICGAIDKIVLQSGLGSMNLSKFNYYYNNIFAISQRMIDLSERKITLINLKVLTEDILSKMPESEAQILIERYFDGKKFRVMAEEKNLCIRTLFRMIDRSENSFSRILISKGFDEQKLEKFFEKEEWIKNVYKQNCTQNCDEFTLSDGYIEKVASF